MTSFYFGDGLYPVCLLVEHQGVAFTVGDLRVPLDDDKVAEFHAVLTGWLEHGERGSVEFRPSPGRLLLSVWGGHGKTYPRAIAHIDNGGLSLEITREQGQRISAELWRWLDDTDERELDLALATGEEPSTTAARLNS